MSTKAIREALLSRGMTHDVSAALAEVEAIEKAAKAVMDSDTEEAEPSKHSPAMERYLMAMELLESIAKQG